MEGQEGVLPTAQQATHDTVPEKVSPQETSKQAHTEIAEGFKSIGYPLSWQLAELIQEPDDMQGGRRGSGFTTATRELATYIGSPRASRDMNILDGNVRLDIEDSLYKEGGDEALEQVDVRTQLNRAAFEQVTGSMQNEESRMLAQMVVDVLFPYEGQEYPVIPAKEQTLRIGTCTTAEQYFLEYVTGGGFGPDRVGHMNFIVGPNNEPIAIEKINRGENHSCLTLTPVVINGVRLPAGSLLGVQYSPDAVENRIPHQSGFIIKADKCTGFEFLRLTTLAVQPENRERAFGSHLSFQGKNAMPGYDSVTIEQYKSFVSDKMSPVDH